MGVFTAVSDRELRQALTLFELGALRTAEGIPQGSVNTNYRLETDAGRFFLRVYEEQPLEGARAEVDTALRLAAAGIPVATPIAQRAVKSLGADSPEGKAPEAKTPEAKTPEAERVFELAGKPAAIFTWRPGHMRCQQSVSPDDARLVGAALARVHAATPTLPVRPGRFDVQQLHDRLARIARATDPELAAQAEPLSKALAFWSARRDPALPRGFVHGDLFRDNVLFAEDGSLSALLDFESACEGVFAYDLVVTVLSWTYGDTFDGSLAKALVGGYESVRPLTPAEKAGVHAEACLAALRFTITRITDYAMREGTGPRIVKDWRRFARRRADLEGLGTSGFRALLGIG